MLVKSSINYNEVPRDWQNVFVIQQLYRGSIPYILLQPRPQGLLLFKMAAAREKTLAHSRSRVSNEDGDVFKMAATAKRVRRTGYEMLR